MTESASSRATRWDEHNAERRQLIVNAAVETINEAPEGAEINVGHVADRAGLVRTVIYRHFKSRDELFRAAQIDVVGGLRTQLEDQLTMDASIETLIARTVASFIDWVNEHPKLYLAAQQDVADGQPSAFAEGLQQIADRISSLIQFVMEMSGVKLRSIDRATVDVVAAGVVGQVRGTIDHWLRLSDRRPSTELLKTIMARTIWFQLDGHARDLGVELRPDVPLRELFAR